ARLASPNGSEHTELSAPYFVEVDSQIEPPVLDFTEINLGSDEADGFVISGTAEPFSEVTVQLTGPEGETSYTATADADGRFHVTVAAGSLALVGEQEEGRVAVAAWATDRAGNSSDAAMSQATIHVHAVAGGEILVGTGDDDIFAPEGSSTFKLPVDGWGKDYYIGSANGFHTVRIDGSAASYTISVLQGEELEPHVTVLSAQDVSLNTD